MQTNPTEQLPEAKLVELDSACVDWDGTEMLSEQQIAEGWLPHDGGPCPVPLGNAPHVMLRSGEAGVHIACNLIWEHDGRKDDIIAYKPEPKP